MREHAPAYWDTTNEVWALTRYADVLAAEKDPATFSSHRAPRPHGDHLPMMISMDDPEHGGRRKLVSRGFTPRRVRDHESTIRHICTEIIDRVAQRGQCDFVWDIAAPLPLLLIADLLGFPPESYDDLLRWVSPIKNMACTVTRDVDLHGRTLRGGDQVILMYPSANRDATVFDLPDQLDVRRDPNPHLAFGFGSHFCMGASLARLELRVMFSELLRRLPDLHLTGDPLPRRSSNFISGPEAMPVAFTPIVSSGAIPGTVR